MPNNLTGDYDAVLLVGVNRINGLLATLHQNGWDADASPTFPHSDRTRIGDRPKIFDPPLSDFAEWFGEVARASSNPGHAGTNFSDKAPPGVAKVLRKFYGDIQSAPGDVVDPPGPTVPLNCRGLVEVQLSAPSISLPAGSTSEVTINVNIRARYYPDPNRPALAEPIHGLVSATYVVKTTRVPNYGSFKTIIEVAPSTDDNKIQFTAAANSGVSQPDVDQIAIQVRRALREGFEPINLELPDDFKFHQFKAIGNGQALALPIRLTAPLDLPDSALSTVNNDFLNADFSVGISRDYFQAQFQPTIDNLMQFRQDFDVGWRWFTVTYHVSVKSAEIQWNDGSLDLIVHAKATASYAPDFDDIVVQQRCTIAVDPASQYFSIMASDSDLSISGIWDFVKGHIQSAIIAARNQALPQAQARINSELGRTRTQINDGLSRIDSAASAQFRGVRITADGLVLDGDLPSKYRTPPVIDFQETGDRTGFTAFKSWIPAGRVDRFEWSWVKNTQAETVWGGVVVTELEDHRFIFPKPPQLTEASNICLRIHGIQVDQHGFAYEIAGGTACAVQTPVLSWAMPAWVEPLPTPIWATDIPADGVLNEHTQGHASVLAHAQPGKITANSIVHFADPKMERPLEKLGKVLAGRKAPSILIVVLPSGTFDGRRGEIEAKLGSLGKSFNGHLILTEDDAGSWKRTFNAATTPSTYLMNGQGQFVWKQEGVFETEALIAALEKNLPEGRVIRFNRLETKPKIGERAPEVLLGDGRGSGIALRKLRGHELLLNFWQPWSTPSIRELIRLEALREKGGETAAVIIGVSGELKTDALDEFRRQHKLGFALIGDPNGSIARSFGVNCWPTTLSIDRLGVVTSVQIGVEHHPAAQKGAQQA